MSHLYLLPCCTYISYHVAPLLSPSQDPYTIIKSFTDLFYIFIWAHFILLHINDHTHLQTSHPLPSPSQQAHYIIRSITDHFLSLQLLSHSGTLLRIWWSFLLFRWLVRSLSSEMIPWAWAIPALCIKGNQPDSTFRVLVLEPGFSTRTSVGLWGCLRRLSRCLSVTSFSHILWYLNYFCLSYNLVPWWNLRIEIVSPETFPNDWSCSIPELEHFVPFWYVTDHVE